MELRPFIKHTVRPGEPLTAQAWNDVVEGIDGAYQFLQAMMHGLFFGLPRAPPSARRR